MKSGWNIADKNKVVVKLINTILFKRDTLPYHVWDLFFSNSSFKINKKKKRVRKTRVQCNLEDAHIL